MKQIPVHEAMRAARKEAGYTQPDLAYAAGIGRTLLSEYERGCVKPTVYNLIALADVLCITIDEYVGHYVKSKPTKKPRRKEV